MANGVTKSDGFASLESFTFCEVLDDSPMCKSVFLRAKSDKGEDVVLLLDKKPFDLLAMDKFFTADCQMKLSVQNDIYGNYDVNPPPYLNGIKATLICPATSKHIEKYRQQPFYLIQETYDDYKTLTLPLLAESKFSLQWVYNVLEKKSEADRIVYEDADPETGFLLLPDLKWDGKVLDNLYLSAICNKRGIKSLRDLDNSHLPLLKNILANGTKAIKAKYGVPKSQLRVYLHYQPSYYHFHVHFTHLKFEAAGSNCTKAHLLSDVIDNIEMIGDYYQRKTLSFTVKESDQIYTRFKGAEKV